MYTNILWIIFIIAACIGAGGTRFLSHKPIKIQFKISAIDKCLYAFFLFAILTAIMLMEFLFNQWQLANFNPVDWRLNFLSRAIDCGLLVAIALPIISSLSGKWAIRLKLDLCREYNINVIKIYYSMVIVANCIWFLLKERTRIINDAPEVQAILNRFFIWILSVFGTWGGIGYQCEGRISEEVKNIRKSKERKNVKEVFVYNVPFLIAFFVNCFVLLMQTFNIKWMQEVLFVMYWIIIGGVLGMSVATVILCYTKWPSEKRSSKKLLKAVRKMEDKKKLIVNEWYQTIQYSLINEESHKYLVIPEQNVIWSGHEEEISSYFGKRKVLLKEFDYEVCKKYLIKLREDRKDFLRKGYISCEKDVREQLIEQNK